MARALAHAYIHYTHTVMYIVTMYNVVVLYIYYIIYRLVRVTTFFSFIIVPAI